LSTRNARRRYLLTLIIAFALPVALNARSMDKTEPRTLRALQEFVDSLKAQLGIDAVITAAVVPTNPLLVSVKRVENARAFVMSFEEPFISGLDDEELRAIVAHELGHVWIFTHHPYLQTERLANTVALRVVSRSSLERVYTKVWRHQGTTVDLAQFLGQ
jgi:hypothetical protein